MKKIFCAILAGLMILSATACGKDENSGEKELSSRGEQTVEINPGDLLMAMRETQVNFPQYATASSHDESGNEIDGWDDVFSLSLYDNFDVSKVKSYAIAYSTAQTADEITVVVLQNEKDAEELKKQMRERVSGRITLFETYGPEEVLKLENARIISKGNVCALIICDEPGRASDAFKEGFSH